MFTAFNNTGHTQLCREIEADLMALAQRHGLSVSAGGGSLGTGELTIKVKLATSDLTAQIAAAKRDLGTYGRSFGLESDDYGAVVRIGSKSYKLVGIKPSRPKFPLEIECIITGKVFKGTAGLANQAIAARKAQQPVAPVFATAQPQMPEKYDPRFTASF